MGIVLGANRYGKAEIRLVQVSRAGPRHEAGPYDEAESRHELTDLNVSVTLAGDLSATHLTGDNSAVLTTDAQKNTVYAFARRYGIGEIEDFGLRLARHFVESQPSIHRARVHIEQYGWGRLGDHSFVRDGTQTRTATVTCDGTNAWVVSGLADLVLLNSTGSEFRGFVRDPYTTLAETDDRILATSVSARWRHATGQHSTVGQHSTGQHSTVGQHPAVGQHSEVDNYWAGSYAGARQALVSAFVQTYSRSLQQTLYAMGERLLADRPELVEVRLALPNKHHFLVDLTPVGLDNPDEVYVATDRPYGLIEGTVTRSDAPEPGLAWW